MAHDIVRIYREPDSQIMDISRDLNPMLYVTPINEKPQKKRFLEDGVDIGFEYRELEKKEHDPELIRRRLEAIRVPEDYPHLHRAYTQKIAEMFYQNGIVAAILKREYEKVRELTVQIYEKLDDCLVSDAKMFLGSPAPKKSEKTITARSFSEMIYSALKEHGIEDWEVELTKKWPNSINRAQKRIKVCEYRDFDENEVRGFIARNLDVNVVRATNGYEQPLGIFVSGFPGYLTTESGLEAYSDEMAGTETDVIRDYAAYVIAVHSVINGDNFTQTFGRLKGCGLSDDEAWAKAMRSHRGNGPEGEGGYIKDHLYLRGFRKVEKLGSDAMKTLYVGKVGIGDLPAIKDLMSEGVVSEAKHLPPFLK